MNLNLKGELIRDEWAELYRMFGFGAGYYCPKDMRDAVQSLEAGEELVLQINSVGGDVDAAAELYSIIQGCSNPTRAEIQSLAASAASYFPLACDRVEIALPAQMMIHCAGWSVSGNKQVHLWAAGQLDTTDNSILDVYCRKCGAKATREQLKSLMEAETYLTAHQCLDLGLVDGIIGDDEPQQDDTPVALVASVTGNVVRAMRTLPDIQTLLARRDAEQWKFRAQLDLELARYPKGD